MLRAHLGRRVDLSNRTLLLFALLTAVLVVLAMVVTFGLDGAAPAPAAPPSVPIIPEVVRTGGTTLDPKGPLTVRRAGGDAATATLVCDTFRSERPFESGVAVFPSVPLGDCGVLLGTAETPYEPVFPGDRLTCRGGAVTECTGGLAASRAARVTITSDIEGRVEVDGEPLGPIPVFGAPMKIGRRELRVLFPSGEATSWSLVVLPDQNIRVHFPDPYAQATNGIPDPDFGVTVEGPPPPAPPPPPPTPAPVPDAVPAPLPSPTVYRATPRHAPIGEDP